jgi:hypothetical protein
VKIWGKCKCEKMQNWLQFNIVLVGIWLGANKKSGENVKSKSAKFKDSL